MSLPPGVLHAGDRVQLVATPEDKRHDPVSTAVHWASADESIAEVSQEGVVSAKSPGEVLVWAESQGVRAMARIEVSPAPVASVDPIVPDVLEVGETAELGVHAFDASGEQLEKRAVRWSSNDSAVAEVLGDQVKGRSAGVARITCNCEGKFGSKDVAIVLPVVSRIVIEPPPAHVDLGLPVPLHAEVLSARGVRIERPLHWKAEPPQIASVDAKGVVLPLREGHATITASADGVEASVALDVNPPPELAMPSGDVSSTQVFELEEARRLLAESDPRLSVVGLSGLATPSTGEDATSIDESDVPNDDGVGVGVPAEAEMQSSAAVDSEELRISEEVLEPWQSVTPPSVYAESADKKGIVDRIGRKRLVGAGAAVLVLVLASWGVAASLSGKSDTTRLNASSGTIADSSHVVAPVVKVDTPATKVDTPAVATTTPVVDSTKLIIASLKPIRVGDSAALRARLASDPRAKLGTINWSSSAPDIIRVNPRTGRIIALKEGSATITGTSKGATGTVSVRVVPGNVVLAGKVAVAKLIMSEVKGTLHPGDTTRVTAAPLAANDENLFDRKVTWQSTHPDVASVDAYGLVTARAPGTSEIVATSEDKSARVTVTVATREVKFSDGTAALRAGGDRFVNAIKDRDGRELSAAFFVDSPDDQKNLDWLLARLRDNDANFRITRTQPGRPAVRDNEATSEVVFTFAWTANGRNYDKKAKFRLNARKTGESWAIATLRSVDRLE